MATPESTTKSDVPGTAGAETSAPAASAGAATETQRARRRQWGAERHSEPLSIVHPRPSTRAILWARVAIISTVVFWAYYLLTTIVRLFVDTPRPDFTFTMEAIGYAIVVTFLTFSALMYLVARLGSMYRYQSHVRVPRGELDRHFGNYRRGITVLVPSYAEETHVVRATLWSAALQEFPDLRIVLLLDDAPFPTDPETLRVL